MSYQNEIKYALRESLKSDLARELGCTVEDIPTAISLKQAAPFMGVTNTNTFYVWKSNKRYPLVWLKRGKSLEIGSASLIELRLNQADIPEGVAA